MPLSASATKGENLIAGRSPWFDDRKPNLAVRKLSKSIKADVAIVGAGVSGAFMAHALSRTHRSIVVVDRRAPAHGSTAASTALLQWEIDTRLTELHDKLGSSATRAWRRSYRATQELIELVSREGIRCGLQARQSLYLAGNAAGSRALKEERKARHRAQLPGEFLSAAELRSRYAINRTGAILSPGSAVANPMQLATGLLKRAISNGAKIYSPIAIQEVLATQHGAVLDSGEHFIEAKKAIFCTGYELLKGIPEKGTEITSSWAIATRPHAAFPNWLNNTVLWEASDPYLYLRTTPDHRLIVGGEDEAVDSAKYRAQNIPRKSERLVAKLRTLIPDCEPHVSYRWSGAFGESDDGLPVIDAVPGMPNCFVVMGFGGNGTIYSMIASQIVPTLIRGKPDRDADIFRFR